MEITFPRFALCGKAASITMASLPLASSWAGGGVGGGLHPDVGGLGRHARTGRAISTGVFLALWGRF